MHQVIEKQKLERILRDIMTLEAERKQEAGDIDPEAVKAKAEETIKAVDISMSKNMTSALAYMMPMMEAPHESEQLMQDEEIPASDSQRAVMNMKCLKALRTERCGPRHVMLMLGFASCLLALGLYKVMPWGKVNVPIQGDILQNWEFEDVNLHSGDKVFDMLFNRTLFQCIEPVKHVAEKRGDRI
eukprot:symbB.v1.2.011179.t1/scaffold742.1/size166083/1